MAREREVLIKLKTVDEGSVRTINLISTALKNLQREISKPVSDTADKTASYKSTSYASAIKNVDRIRTENLRAEKIIAAEITRSDTALANSKIRINRDAAKNISEDFIRAYKRIRHEADITSKNTSSIFGSVLGGSFFGSLGAKAVSSFTSAIGALPSIVSDIFAKSADFSQATVSLAQFSGSLGAAQEKILQLTQVAAATPGLSFSSAVEGQKRLQAIGFEADKATEILVGLAKVRLLSGSTKQDFDATILNLTQIASGGQKVGQEIRELIGRMPAFAAVIRKEFGTLSGEVLNKLDPKEFVSRLAVATSSMNAEFASSSQAAENLSDAIDRIKIAVGSIIEQNPEVIALLRLMANEIDGVSGSLATNESAQRSAFSTFVSGLAKGTVAAANFADEFQTKFRGLTNDLSTRLSNAADVFGGVVNLTLQSIKTLGVGAVAGIATVFDLMLNGFQKSVNQMIETINRVTVNLPVPQIPLVPIVESVSSFAEQMRAEAVASFQKIGIANNLLYRNLESNSRRSTANELGNIKAKEDAELRSYNRTRTFNNLVERERKAVEKRKGQTFEKQSGFDSGGAAGTGTSGGKKKKTKSEADRITDSLLDSVQLRKIAEGLGFVVTSTIGGKHNLGSKHGKGLAIDVRTRDKTPQEIEFLIGELEKKGVFVRDERRRPKGQKVYGGPHLHLEDARLHGGRVRKNEEGFERFIADKSAAATKAARESETRALVAAANLTRTLPDTDVIRDYNRLLVEAAEKIGGIQESIEQTTERFKGFRERPTIEDAAETRERPEKVNPFADTAAAIKALDERRKNIGNEILDASVRYGISLGENKLDLEVELELLKRRNLEFEASNDFIEQQGLQIRTIGDIEKELIALRLQNADTQFVANRRLIDSKSEEKSLKEEITQLQDRLANNGINDGLEIQAALLRDVLGLRRQELDAVISINRSQLELSQKGVFSQAQSDAKVFEFLNQNIKSTTDLVTDFRIGIGESFFAAIDAPFKAISDRLSGLNPIIKGLAQTFLNLANDIVRAFSQKIIMRLLGLDGGGSSQQSGFGGGSASGGGGFLQNIFGSIFGGGSSGNRSAVGTSGGNLNLGSIFGGATGNSGIFNFGGGGAASAATRPRIFDPISAIGANTRGIGAGQGGFFSGNRLAGGIGIAGLIATLAGSALGGTAGSVLTGAGAGIGVVASLASLFPKVGAFAGPLGLAVGAGIGGLTALFASIIGRNSRRKKEEKLRTEYLTTAFADLKGFDQLINDVRALRIEPSSAITQGESLGSTIRTQYIAQANALKDKKTRNIALKDVSRIEKRKPSKQSKAVIRRFLATIKTVAKVKSCV
ncbi:MAG: tape measure protein [Acidobacteriota bacterium]|nr:tape measure protein [Acidobacteriota bacterium]